MRWQGIAIAVGLLLTAASEPVPRLDMHGTCSARAEASAAEKTAAKQCLRSEGDARAELRRRWSGFDREARRTCTAEVRIGGPPSYVELLVCLQMSEWSRAPALDGGKAARHH